MLYDFMYMWNLKQRNKQVKQKETDSQIKKKKLVIGRGVGGWEKQGSEIKRYAFEVTK